MIAKKGYYFRYVLEEEGYVPEEDFVPLIWKRNDDGEDRGNEKGSQQDRSDPSKRSKTTDGTNTADSEQQSAADVVPMNTANSVIVEAAGSVAVKPVEKEVQILVVSATWSSPPRSSEAGILGSLPLAGPFLPQAAGAGGLHTPLGTPPRAPPALVQIGRAHV